MASASAESATPGAGSPGSAPSASGRTGRRPRRCASADPTCPAPRLGARAIYLGSSLYRIHGSNEPETIGQAVSSGCFRLTNDDVVDLYSRVSVGTTVVVKN